jgi:hypothetical protein
MQKEIDAIIAQAITEDWFNEMTTSDLQGVCEACARGIYSKNHVDKPRDFKNKLMIIMEISDKILYGIYDATNPF